MHVVDVLCTALPVAHGMKRSENRVEGDTLELHCNVWGWPKPSILWAREARPLNFSDPRVKVDNDKLMIESLVLADRDYYHCMVTSHFNDSDHDGKKDTTLVRVKGSSLYHQNSRLTTATFCIVSCLSPCFIIR